MLLNFNSIEKDLMKFNNIEELDEIETLILIFNIKINFVYFIFDVYDVLYYDFLLNIIIMTLMI